uniref:NADH:ubiquinone reductase (H(+)-translocating) n=1 Tax=Macrostomum lignano TaxID=282301 RepID=A0A1Z1LZZ0_9PLAT|nr:NADH dehydrogenase subunit 5 [Macrostomum lignano]ARW59248.1 NADH dehydrogenase subunit 5 [Macrostomum lignano]ATA64830.1 NADH dehydrogenase subunit 5 [Macrostomum lignano]
MGNIFFFFSLFFFYLGFSNISVNFKVFEFNSIFSFVFFFDWISFVFLGVLMVILGSVVYFSCYYMGEELIRGRGFIFVVFSFVVAMGFLIISGDWISLIIGWDWLGITSFFLVCYYNSDSSWSGGLKTYFTNRLGDGIFLFLLSNLFIYFIFSNFYLGTFYLFLIILLSQTKSAQLPFSSWLPAAMAAPTPVSALVHSSTLVTAGVYILIRSGSILGGFNWYLGGVGLLTLFVGSFSACGSFDLKKIVAFSTLSHLGFMVMSLSSVCVDYSFFHLIVHACFKALLFISVGMLILTNNHSQDFRQVGFSFNNLFFIWVSLVSLTSLCGFPFFSGFFSKDFTLEMFFWSFNPLFYFLFFFSIFFSVFYSVRLINAIVSIQWSNLVKEYSIFNIFYMIFLLLSSVVIGVVFSGWVNNLQLISGNFLFKFLVYFFLLGGVLFFYQHFNGLISSSIFFLDSLGGGIPNNLTNNFWLFYNNVDQGVLPFFSERLSAENFMSFSKVIQVNLFLYFWGFFIIFYFF